MKKQNDKKLGVGASVSPISPASNFAILEALFGKLKTAQRGRFLAISIIDSLERSLQMSFYLLELRHLSHLRRQVEYEPRRDKLFEMSHK